MKVLAVVALGILVACGSESEKNKESEGFLTEVSYDPAEYYNILNACTPEMRNGKVVTFNVKGEVLEDKVCTYDATTRIHKVTERRLENGSLAVKSYTEITFNANNRIVDSKEWTSLEKTALSYEYAFTYSADGKLTKSVRKFYSGQSVATTTTVDYDANETPSKSTSTSDLSGSSSVTVDTCNFFFGDSNPCEKIVDGKVQESVVLEGEELVRKRLINNQMLEVARYTYLGENLGLYKSRKVKDYDFEGKLESELTESCNQDGDIATCSETRKLASGETTYSLNSTYQNFGKLKVNIGAVEKIVDGYIETKGNFTAIYSGHDYSGTLSSTFDPATFDVTSDITFNVVKTIQPGVDSSYVATPNWLDTSASLDDIFKEGATGAVSMKSSTKHNDRKLEVLAEIKDIQGIAVDDISPTFEVKEESTYQ